MCLHGSVKRTHLLFHAMSEKKKNHHRHGKEKTAEKGRKIEHSSRQMKQYDCLVISFFTLLCIVCSFTRFTVFIMVLSSSYVVLLGHLMYVCVCVCLVYLRVLLSFRNVFFQDERYIFIETETHPEYYMLAHFETFSFSQVFFAVFFCCVLLLIIHSIDPVFNCNANFYMCMHMRMRKRTTTKNICQHMVKA